MQIAFVYGRQPSSTLTKFFTGSTCYHVGFTNGEHFWDMNLIRRRRARGKLHQVGKPLPLMEELVMACGPRILDPFMGSGTTGAAALWHGKDFVGIEASAHYFR